MVLPGVVIHFERKYLGGLYEATGTLLGAPGASKPISPSTTYVRLDGVVPVVTAET